MSKQVFQKSKGPIWPMERALQLAKKGRAWTLPNPMVGAVIVKNGRILGEGFHRKFGAPHAEVEALKNCKESPKRATLYVSLEPCCHYGKTAPCTEAIIKSGIQKVWVATLDPSGKVNGKGRAALKKAGIEVKVGLLKERAEELNREFFTFHRERRPFITLKAAISLDGKISASRKKQTRLTGKASLKETHLLRHYHQAILIGAGTLLSDNPHLGVRLLKGRDPLRIILEGNRKLPRSSRVFRDAHILLLKNKTVPELLKTLYDKNIVSVLVEGGQRVFNSFLKAGYVDELKLFIAPRVLGKKALSLHTLKTPLPLSKVSLKALGKDYLLTATLKP